MKTKVPPIKGTAYKEPFPHLIIENFYNDEELELVWEELKFLTKPGKLLEAKHFGGIEKATNSHALCLDSIYQDYSNDDEGPNYRKISNILTVNRKLFNSNILNQFAEIHDSCITVTRCDSDTTKVRYYHDGEYYDPHTDASMSFLAFSYFHKEPKKFKGGDLIFPRYNCQLTCENNSMIILPAWVEHGVTKVSIENSDYYDGWGRYSITNFLQFDND